MDEREGKREETGINERGSQRKKTIAANSFVGSSKLHFKDTKTHFNHKLFKTFFYTVYRKACLVIHTYIWHKSCYSSFSSTSTGMLPLRFQLCYSI